MYVNILLIKFQHLNVNALNTLQTADSDTSVNHLDFSVVILIYQETDALLPLLPRRVESPHS